MLRLFTKHGKNPQKTSREIAHPGVDQLTGKMPGGLKSDKKRFMLWNTHRHDLGPGAHGADVEHEHLILQQLAHLALLLIPLHQQQEKIDDHEPAHSFEKARKQARGATTSQLIWMT